MSNVVIKAENLYKEYQLGTIGYGTLRQDIQSWWARVRGKEDPNATLSYKALSKDNQDDRFLALNNVSFEINRGDIVGVIGRNGAGKSTLLKIISRVTAPTSGFIKIKGRVASLLEVGTGFHPELTGRENVYLNGTILGMTRQEINKKFDEIVAFAEVEKFIDTPVKRYSSGMYVRLAFAVAAHLEPEILIVDEVLAVGDAQFQKKCLGKMKDVGEEGRTVLFVSHNMGAINVLCRKGIFLSKGKIKFIGDTSRAINQYLSEGYLPNAIIEYKNDISKDINVSKVSLLDAKGLPSVKLDLLQPFTIEMEYIVNRVVSGAVVSCNILTDRGEVLLATADYDLDKSKLGSRKLGVNRTSVTIPDHILNSGIYYLVVGISSPGKCLYDRHEVLQFELFDSGSFVVNGGGEERRNSLLLLSLPWK